MKEEIKTIRELLSVPPDQRIGQWIYNKHRDLEVRIEDGGAGVDIFSVSDDNFMERLTK